MIFYDSEVAKAKVRRLEDKKKHHWQNNRYGTIT